MLMFPKPTKKVKKPKPLKRSRKPIATRSRFKEFNANPTKTYRRRYTDYQVMCQAEVCRQQRLRNPTAAEEAFAGILNRLGIKFEREKIILNGDRFVLLDFYIPSVKLVVELDGAQHRGQKGYDMGRSMWLARVHGLHVVRFWNKAVMDGTAEARIRQMLGL